MQLKETERAVQAILESGICIINGLLSLALYVADANHSTSGVARTGFGVLAEVGFAIGLAAVVVVVIARKIFESFNVRWRFLVLSTFWNQICVLMFLASAIPFRLH